MDVSGALAKLAIAINKLLEAGELLELAPATPQTTPTVDLVVSFVYELDDVDFSLMFSTRDGLSATRNGNQVVLV